MKIGDTDHAELANAWLATIRAGVKHRKTFSDQYKTAKQFAYGDHAFMYPEESAFKATVPKVWEMISIFGPMLAFQNPHRNAKVRYEKQQDPRAPRAKAIKDLLNYSSDELYLVKEMRECVDESIIGCGVMWLEKDRSGFWGHFHDCALNLVIDPDAETLADAWWVARKHTMPRWEFANMVDASEDHDELPSGRPSVQTTVEGVERQSDTSGGEREPAGHTNELITVYEVWSKMGMGYRLANLSETFRDGSKTPKNKEDYVHFFVAPTSKRLWGLGEWPVQLWADNEWPCEMLYFRKKRNYVWPVPLITPSLGLQKAINWVMMFMWQHLKSSAKDYVAIPNDLDETVRERLLSGNDLETIPYNPTDLESLGGDYRKLMGFLQHPEMRGDLWRYMDLAIRLFEDSTGLYPALYASAGSAEPRSATGSRDRSDRANLRPDDMRKVVERAHTRMARKEALAMILDDEFDAEFVGSVLGPEAAEAWGQYQEGDLWTVMREFDYTVAAGSATKPNIQEDQKNALDSFDRDMQIALQTGDFAAVNQIRYQLHKAFNRPDGEFVQIQPPPPPPQEEEEPPEPGIEEKIRGEAAKADLTEAKTKTEYAKMRKELGAQEADSLDLPPTDSGEVIAVRDGSPISV